MNKQKQSVISMLRNIRQEYYEAQKFHYLMFAAFALILLLDFIIIIYVRAESIDWYAWSGIIILFTLLFTEAIQYTHYKKKKDSVDWFYLRGEYEVQTKARK